MQGERFGQFLFINEALIKCKKPRRKARGISQYWHFVAIAIGICMVVMALTGQ